jgi:hypothetical protein
MNETMSRNPIRLVAAPAAPTAFTFTGNATQSRRLATCGLVLSRVTRRWTRLSSFITAGPLMVDVELALRAGTILRSRPESPPAAELNARGTVGTSPVQAVEHSK